MYQKKILFILIFEVLIIIALIGYIGIKNHENYSIAPMKRMEIINSPSKVVKYFYEPKPYTTIHDIPLYFSLDYEPIYTINKDALHERFSYKNTKDKQTFRIITLGDSFTFGHYVNTKDNWSERLEDVLNTQCQKYKNYEVINLGVYGYDISYSVERFIQRGRKYNPDLVIWLLKTDGFEAINDITNGKLMKLKKELILNGALKKSIEKGEFYPHAVTVKKEFLQKYGRDNVPNMQENFLQIFTKHFKNSLVFLSLKNFTRENEEKIMDKIVKTRKDSFYYKDFPEFDRLPDRHPSIRGHKEIAENIYTYMTSKKIIACK